jgi:hypothetical protein
MPPDKDERASPRKGEFWLGCLIPSVVVLLLLVGLPYAFLAFAFWAVEGSWDFEGRNNLRYWLFVKGTRVERLGLIAPTQAPASYSVRLQEGNFPGWTVVIYRSTAEPDAVAKAYAQRCREMGLKITRGPEPNRYGDEENGASLVCEIEPYLDAEFHAGRKPGETTSEVSMRVWGDD